ncbi:MAG: transposase [Oligoflexia bacterium]|nr:transposase [Oligoflexia bacterium]
MLTGIKFLAKPSTEQKIRLSQWMGCARVIWNAKCEEDEYLRKFSVRYLPVGTYPPIDQTFSQYKTELTPWLKDCPSQILRNSAVNWYQTYQKFLKGICGRPRKKRKGDASSIHLTREVFILEKDAFGNFKLFIGSKTNNIGYLRVKFHTNNFSVPNSIRIRREKDRYYVSFCYEDGIDGSDLWEKEQYLKHFSQFSSAELDEITIGIDRGIKRPVQAGDSYFDLSDNEKRKRSGREKYFKRPQRRLSKQKKGSRRRELCKTKLGKTHQRISNIRNNFCHQTSKRLVQGQSKILVFEDLKTKNMNRSARGTVENPGKKVRAKSGLNRNILNQAWFKLETFVEYKAHRSGKVVFKVSPHHTSQECADCGHTHPDNRVRQDLFVCTVCGNTDNADRNASRVIKKRAINLILDSGTELSKKGVLVNSS